MGKTQSKRSVDITTETKKGPEEEVTGKLEKIEDLDQKQVNGDANPQENTDAEKKENDESENDKDLTTEKSGEAAQAGGDNADQNNTTATAVEDGKDDSAAPKEGGAGTEEISPLSDDSIKKSKKEKLKKKWSFRSISFGKKDKQKPSKTEEAATNGEAEKAVTEGVTDSAKKEGDGAATGNDAEVQSSVEKHEVEIELNGPKTSTPTEDKPAEVVATENTTNATTDTSNVNVVPAATNETAIQNQTETNNKAATNSVEDAVEATATAAAVSNGADAAAIEKNGAVESLNTEENKKESTDNADTEVSAAINENNKTIPNVINEEKPHQNGMNVDEVIEGDADKSKSQIEVNTNIDNLNATDLTYSQPNTYSDPNAQSNNTQNASKTINEAAAEAAAAIVAVAAEENITSGVVNVADDAVVAAVDVDITNTKPNEENKQNVLQFDMTPPPLPISPPPSHVSVFAFKNNTEADEISTAQAAVEPMPAETNTAQPTTEKIDTIIETNDEQHKVDQVQLNSNASVSTEAEVNFVGDVDGSIVAAIAVEESLPQKLMPDIESETDTFMATADEISEITNAIKNVELEVEPAVVAKQVADVENEPNLTTMANNSEQFIVLETELAAPTVVEDVEMFETITPTEDVMKSQEPILVDTEENTNDVVEEVPTAAGNETDTHTVAWDMEVTNKEPAVVDNEQLCAVKSLVDDVTQSAAEIVEQKLQAQEEMAQVEAQAQEDQQKAQHEPQEYEDKEIDNVTTFDISISQVAANTNTNTEYEMTSSVAQTEIITECVNDVNNDNDGDEFVSGMMKEVLQNNKMSTAVESNLLVHDNLLLNKDDDYKNKNDIENISDNDNDNDNRNDNDNVYINDDASSVCLTKETANAKELKENAMAENTTQDLPVTSE